VNTNWSFRETNLRGWWIKDIWILHNLSQAMSTSDVTKILNATERNHHITWVDHNVNNSDSQQINNKSTKGYRQMRMNTNYGGSQNGAIKQFQIVSQLNHIEVQNIAIYRSTLSRKLVKQGNNKNKNRMKHAKKQKLESTNILHARMAFWRHATSLRQHKQVAAW